MYSIYWNGEYIGYYEKKYDAYLTIRSIVINNHGEILKHGTETAVDTNGEQHWYLVKFLDENGNPSYEAMSIIKDN